MGEAKRRRLAGERQRLEIIERARLARERQLLARWQALDATDRKIIDRLVEAVKTGKPCGTSGIAAISAAGFSLLNHRKLLALAMGAVGEIEEDPHPRAQQRFVRTWSGITGSMLRQFTCNDEAFFSGLRVLLPAYDGPAQTLYRGQLFDDPPGVSWTLDYYRTAMKFALYGDKTVPKGADILQDIPGLPLRKGKGFILQATVPAQHIISAPCMHKGGCESEFVIDPRYMTLADFEAGDALEHRAFQHRLRQPAMA